MPPVDAEAADARRQLERVLESPGFARNERLSRFLRFVVERHLEDRDHELKESVIAVEVFGRSPDFNPKRDPIVRTEGGRLRARLSDYYSGDGKSAPVVIELPKGGYVPKFRQADGTAKTLPRSRVLLERRAWLAIALAGSLLTLAGMGWWWAGQKNAPVAIAVLPLENLSQDRSSDYFADGLTDELIRNLSIIDGLSVRSRTSSFAFKGRPRNVREVGKQLAVDYILEGSILRNAEQLRINAQLVRVHDDFPLWSGKFDRKGTDIFVIQDEISRGIVNNLRLKLGHGRRRYETSVEAYDLYLRARALENQGGGQGRGVDLFEEAISKDPSFAPAYAGLAAHRAGRSGFFRSDHADEAAKMRIAAEKAIQLDPLLAEAHDALGMAHAHDAQWEQSEKSFRKAIELDPGRSQTYAHFSMYLLLPLGRTEEALREVRAAEKADPLSPSVQYWMSYVLFSAGRYEEAAGHCDKQSPSVRSECLGRARLGQGRIDEAIRILEANRHRNSNPSGVLGYAYARAGRSEEAEKLAAGWEGDPIGQAMTFAGLGDKDRTLQVLEQMAPLGPFRVGRALTFPEFALLRGDPRVKAIRKKVGLPE